MSSTREKLITLLAKHSHTFVSGQWLSEQLNLSRTAVWKQIKQLKLDGYEFEATPNKGYRLVSTPDKISQNTIYWGLQTKWLGKPLQYYDELPSTQIHANQEAQAGASQGLVVVAERQTAGKGRLNRTWFSNNSGGLWFSFILRPTLLPTQAPQLTLLTATVLAEVIANKTNLQPSIKWPNDLLIGDKKVAGILTEMQAEQDGIHYLVIGIGLNINQGPEAFDDRVKNRATSLSIEAQKRFDKRDLLQAILTRFEYHYEHYLEYGFEQVKKNWESYGYRINQSITYVTRNQTHNGIIKGIAEDGALLVETKNKSVERLYSAEIAWFEEV
ncbi:biotin--[acetyl-CoA-carboxylase] ligase [Amphibacillus sediminis]|uniref:biotin--[acetyl-CoA-carboxylase] ligase n=1 Tax=Amphibacillus sediminis TaxID=360185 RepID=UPI000829F83F|nr:biotin--[acetyl-CoA-carboxylase] ligase [Amphibacillus sediminis]